MTTRTSSELAAVLVLEVVERTGKDNWQKTVRTLARHYHSAAWDREKALKLITNNVQDAKRTGRWPPDALAVTDAAERLYNMAIDGIEAIEAECRHPRKQRQADEYFCPDCGRRWEVDEEYI